MIWNDRIGQRLKLRDLHYLMAVARAGSMAKAAVLLGVSQPVLSKTIAELELLLGVRLLDRGPRGVEPTNHGQRLLAAGHAIFDELRLGVKEIDHLLDPATGELALGSNEASMIGIVPATIERLRRDHPRAVVRVIVANTPVEQQNALRERRVDFAIGRIAEPFAPDEFETELLFNQEQVVVVGEDNPWARRSRVDLAELLREPWVLPSLDTTSGQLAADVFRECGLPMPCVAVVTSSFLLNRGLLERGPYLALMPATILTTFMRTSSLRRVPVALPPRHAPVGIVKLRKRAPSPLAIKFMELARGYALELRPRGWSDRARAQALTGDN